MRVYNNLPGEGNWHCWDAFLKWIKGRKLSLHLKLRAFVVRSLAFQIFASVLPIPLQWTFPGHETRVGSLAWSNSRSPFFGHICPKTRRLSWASYITLLVESVKKNDERGWVFNGCGGWYGSWGGDLLLEKEKSLRGMGRCVFKESKIYREDEDI